MLCQYILNAVVVFVGSFPCGQITVRKEAPKKKREASSFGDTIDTFHDYEETELTYDDSLSDQNFTRDENFITQSPSLRSQGEALLNTAQNNSNSKTENGPDVRVVGGNDCKPGQCPWQVNGCVMHLGVPVD